MSNNLQMGKRVIVLTSQFFDQLRKGYQEVARWYRQVGHLMLDRVMIRHWLGTIRRLWHESKAGRIL